MCDCCSLVSMAPSFILYTSEEGSTFSSSKHSLCTKQCAFLEMSCSNRNLHPGLHQHADCTCIAKQSAVASMSVCMHTNGISHRLLKHNQMLLHVMHQIMLLCFNLLTNLTIKQDNNCQAPAGELPWAIHPHTIARASSDSFQALQNCQCCVCGASHWVHQGHQKVHV